MEGVGFSVQGIVDALQKIDQGFAGSEVITCIGPISVIQGRVIRSLADLGELGILHIGKDQSVFAHFFKYGFCGGIVVGGRHTHGNA